MKAGLGARFGLTWKQPPCETTAAVKPQQRTAPHVLAQNISSVSSLPLVFTLLSCLNARLVV